MPKPSVVLSVARPAGPAGIGATPMRKGAFSRMLLRAQEPSSTIASWPAENAAAVPTLLTSVNVAMTLSSHIRARTHSRAARACGSSMSHFVGSAGSTMLPPQALMCTCRRSQPMSIMLPQMSVLPSPSVSRVSFFMAAR